MLEVVSPTRKKHKYGIVEAVEMGVGWCLKRLVSEGPGLRSGWIPGAAGAMLAT